MSRKQKTLVILGVLLLAGFTVLTISLFHRRSSSQNQQVVAPQPFEARSASIPPAPPPVHAPNSKPIPKPIALAAPDQYIGPSLFYDEKLSFEANLERLKEFCRSHDGDQRLEQLLAQFVKILLEKASQQFAAAKRILENLDGPAAYRNVVLGCLMAADALSAEKANIVWRTALDAREPVGVRRTASFLTGQVEDSQRRPADLYTLLTDPDSQIALFALQNATRHLDQRDYDLIRTNLVNSPDVHLQVAAITIIGNAPFPDAQATLANILGAVQTSQNEAFSEPSLLKRAAIAYLDMRDPGTFQAIKRIALDENEDPGVRAKAIARFTPSQFPGAESFLTELLNRFDADTSLPLRATIDVLLTDPTPAHVQAIRQRLARLSDPQLRDALLKRVDVVIKGGKQ
jgi:hypothetical protein